MGIDDPVVYMYSKEVSTVKMTEILEELLHYKCSKSTVSGIAGINIAENKILSIL